MKTLLALVISLLLITLTSCDSGTAPNTIRVGTIAGPETELMETAKHVAKEKYNLNIKIITFNDYIQPNTALAQGSLDANMFQHQPYLDEQIKAKHYNITAVARTFVYPMAIYSKKITSLSQLKKGDTVGIPNDPTNEGRALLLLQDAKLLTLKPGADLLATPADIMHNPNNLTFKELGAPLIPRSLNDLTLGVINTNYALPAGLTPEKNALFIESTDSPYANIVAVRTEDINNENIKHLIDALHSDAVLEKAKTLFPGGAAIPAWHAPNTQ